MTAGLRWSEEDLTNFKKNSGRGLPKATLQVIANSTGKAVDMNGDPVPATPAELAARFAVKETKRRMEPAKKRKAKRVMSATEAHIRAAPSGRKVRAIANPQRPNNPLTTPAHVRSIDNKFLKNLDASAAAARNGKYKNTKRVRDGIRFDSILEADYYSQLEFERKAGVVSYYLRQVPLHLPGGVILRVDFVTFSNRSVFAPMLREMPEQALWEVHYIDTKGFHTRESKNKIKMAEHLYGIKIELVKKVRKLRS
jgi:hypothetical protein